MSDIECKTCKILKPLDAYSTKGKGKSTICKECVAKKGNETREKKKVEAHKLQQRSDLNQKIKDTAAIVDTLDLSELYDRLKDFTKQIHQLKQ